MTSSESLRISGNMRHSRRVDTDRKLPPDLAASLG
jgi:hypothetical protein